MTPAPHVVVVSGGLVHPGPLARRALFSLLRSAMPGREVRRVYPPAALLTELTSSDQPPSVPDPSLVVLFFHEPRSPAAPDGFVEALRSHLERGGRVLALHAATASFKQDNAYRDLLGGRFAGHGRFGRMEVRPESEWARVRLESFVVRDEPYRHEQSVPVAVHLTDAEGEPIVWSREEGAGRLLYASFGHRAAVFRNAGVRSVITASVRELLEVDP